MKERHNMNYFSKEMIKEYLYRGNFGLERESLRIDGAAHLSHTLHPFKGIKNIDRDFCENQIEIITDVYKSVDDLYSGIENLHSYVVKRLYNLESGREYLWPFSNPPYVLNDDDIKIAHFDPPLESKNDYRKYLSVKYGKRKMLYSGIHFNFSFSGDMLRKAAKECGNDICSFKNSVYLNLAKYMTRYSWLIVYLTAASSVRDGSLICSGITGEDITDNLASPRCSSIGYWNDFIPILDYSNLSDYIKSIEKYVDNGMLREPAELYYPVRVKPVGQNRIENLREKGINHIEIRTIDLNPLVRTGIDIRDIEFIYLMIAYFASLDSFSFREEDQINAIRDIKKAARYDDTKISVSSFNGSENIRDAAAIFLDEIGVFYESMDNKRAIDVIEFQRKKTECPSARYAVKVRELYGNNYVMKGLELVRKYAEEINEKSNISL